MKKTQVSPIVFFFYSISFNLAENTNEKVKKIKDKRIERVPSILELGQIRKCTTT